MKHNTITFIGGGHMAHSLIGGLIQDGYPAQKLWVAEPDNQRREALQQDFAIHTTSDNHTAVTEADVVVLAVKPQVISDVASQLAATLQNRKPLVISIAAGINTRTLHKWLGDSCAIVRAMPNTPALVQCGATALYATNQVTEEQRDSAESIMRAVGLTLWLDDEKLMDAVTALSGSGPSYFFLIMEALEKGAMQLGLPQETARLLTLQTAFGAAKMALESKAEPAVLRERVTSPGGTTEQALGVLTDARVPEIFADALQAAAKRADELSQLLGESNG